MTTSTDRPTPERLFQFAFGFVPPLMIEAAVHHHVFDVLNEGPKSLQEVSRATGASERGLGAIMNALVALGLLAKEESLYRLTPESAAFLVSASPAFQGGIFRHTSKQLIPQFLDLTEIVRTGRPSGAVNQEGFGSAFFEAFVEDIFPMSYAGAQALGDALGLAEAKEPVAVLDIAAGSGVWGVALAQKSPHVQVTAVDWPNVIPVTKRVAARLGVGEQFRYIEGDISTVDLGQGYRVATLGHILHSEGEQRSRELLRKVFEALAPGGEIVIAEMVADEERTGPPHAMIFAVNMLVHTDEGDTFTFGEMSSWLQEAGFTAPRQLPAPGPSPLILATKPG